MKFDLQAASVAPGVYSLVASNPDGSTATLPSAFTVVQGGRPELWVDVVGPSVFRIGSIQTYQTYSINYGNTGNVDAGPTAVSVSFPQFMDGVLTSAPGSVMTDSTDEGDAMLTTLDPSISIGSAKTFTLELALPNPQSVQPHEPFAISAWLDSESSLEPTVASLSATGQCDITNVIDDNGNAIQCPGILARTPECNALTVLADHGIKVKHCPCPANCLPFFCPTKMNGLPPLPTYCNNCTNVALILNNLFRLSLIPTESKCSLTITAGNECDSHGNSRCSHRRGFKVDLRKDPSCLDSFLQGTAGTSSPFMKSCRRGGDHSQQYVDVADQILAADENPNGPNPHWDLTFYDSGGPCDGQKCGNSTLRSGQFITPGDPNDKTGSVGQGPQQYLSGRQPLRYSVFFENVAAASAPAQQVVIADPLDPTSLDLTTLALGPIVFGGTTIVPPPGLTQYSTNVDFRPTHNLIVGVRVNFDSTKGILTWKFTSFDGTTGLPTTDPSLGFLPPNVAPPQGQGAVFFTVMPKKGLATDTPIQNQATVVFDALAPIATQTWLNTIDNTNPMSQMSALPMAETSANFKVAWSGTDVGSGVKDFNIYVSDDSGPFVPFLTNTTETSATFPGVIGHSYGFFSQARDLVGNVEVLKTKAEAKTTIVKGGPPVAKCTNVTVPTDLGKCSASASIDNGSSDPDGDTVTVSQTPAPPYPLGTTAVTLTATDTEKLTSTCTANVTVVDKQSPTISAVSASPNVLWPPNKKMIPVTVSVSASDNCDQNPVCKITAISENEPGNGKSPDWQITGNLTASLKADRTNAKDPRVYTLTVQCADAAGNSSGGTTTVSVQSTK